MPQNDYALIDSGDGRKLERFGEYVLIRPCAQAIWRPQHSPTLWESAHAGFERTAQGHHWHNRGSLPESWTMALAGIDFKLSATNFGHVGIFPEQAMLWQWLRHNCRNASAHEKRQLSILNLFAYSGGSTLAAALGGAAVTHVDASSGMVTRARENAELNRLPKQAIRWMVDDVNKFLQRELRRENFYDGIILDPPTFGRGNKGEVYKSDDQLFKTLTTCRKLLSSQPVFILLSSHTPGYTPQVLSNMMAQTVNGLNGTCDSGEMVIPGGQETLPLPAGAFSRWLAPLHGESKFH